MLVCDAAEADCVYSKFLGRGGGDFPWKKEIKRNDRVVRV